MFKTLLLLISGNVGSALLSLVRNLIIARLLPVEDYGIAATFAVAMTAVEVISNLGMQQQIVQSKRGEELTFQASLQGFNVLRGLAGGVLLFLSADAIALFLDIPEVAWAYQLLAAIPVMTSLFHYDMYRLKRQMRFGAEVAVLTVPLLFSLASVWPTFLLFGDYRVMLIALLVQNAASLVISHIMAERPYQLGLDRDVILGALRFGWPLLINSVLLFAIFNGEKVIAGRELGMVALGLLAMGITLTFTPTLVMSRAAQSFFLPQLSALQDNHAQFQNMSILTIQAVFAATLLYLAAVVLVLRPIADLLLGPSYAALMPLLIWLGILQAVRLARIGASVVALARAQTSNAMWANLARLSVLPVAWWVVAASNGGLLTLIWLGILAETLGFLVSLWLIRSRVRLSLRPFLWPVMGLGLITVVTAGLGWTTADALWVPPGQSAVFVSLMVAVLWSFRPLWTYLYQRNMVRAKI